MTNTNTPGIVDRATLKAIYQTLTKNEVPLDKNGDTINFNPPDSLPPILTGIIFKCASSHQWESAVGGVWLQMPYCPECHRLTNQREQPVAWIGKWNKAQP